MATGSAAAPQKTPGRESESKASGTAFTGWATLRQIGASRRLVQATTDSASRPNPAANQTLWKTS